MRERWDESSTLPMNWSVRRGLTIGETVKCDCFLRCDQPEETRSNDNEDELQCLLAVQGNFGGVNFEAPGPKKVGCFPGKIDPWPLFLPGPAEDVTGESQSKFIRVSNQQGCHPLCPPVCVATLHNTQQKEYLDLLYSKPIKTPSPSIHARSSTSWNKLVHNHKYPRVPR